MYLMNKMHLAKCIYIYGFFFRMANNKVVPVVALARRAINDFVAFEDAVTRSVAALSTYVAEGNVERARSESRFIRGGSRPTWINSGGSCMTFCRRPRRIVSM